MEFPSINITSFVSSGGGRWPCRLGGCIISFFRRVIEAPFFVGSSDERETIMKSLAISILVLPLLASVGLGATGSATPAGKSTKTQAAAKIVEDVLQREARESIADRTELLKPAFEKVPNYYSAMWLSGFVFESTQKQWMRFDEVPAELKADDRLATYRAMRPKYADSVNAQLELARWCLKRNLTDQARAHLTKVLEIDQDNPEARRLLGQRLVAGNWLSESDMATAEEQIKNQLAAFRKWKPKLEKIQANLQHAKRQSDAARDELMAIRDPEAATAIEVILCGNGGYIALLGIEALKKLPGREPAASLSRLAVLAPWEPLGRQAAQALGSQSKHDYVPQLLSLTQTPVQSQSQIFQSFNNGTLLFRQAFYREGQNQKELAVLDTPYRHIFTNRSSSSAVITKNVPSRAAINRQADAREEQSNDIAKRAIAMEQFKADAMQKAAQSEAALAQYNFTANTLNSRICDILTQANLLEDESPSTGEDSHAKAARPVTPAEWSQWWNDYNEVYTPTAPPRVVYASNPVKASISQPTRTAYITPSSSRPLFGYECLTGDTMVWTETGPVAIKDVVVGDRVFACDVETGCLALKPVLRKTYRAEENTGELVTIDAGNATISASGGHVFWVAGQGWIKARDLKPGMRLHTLKGTAVIDTIGSKPAQETYNLVVADFHSYFAGDQQSLTHDNTVRQPTNMILPGLPKLAADKP